MNEGIYFSFLKGYETKEPIRATPGSAGVDVFLPKLNDEFCHELRKCNILKPFFITSEYINMLPHSSILIPTGITVENRMLNTYIEVGTKSGIFTKMGLKVGSHVIDQDYQGQIYISLYNTRNEEITLFPDKAIAQLIVIHCDLNPWTQIPLEEIHKDRTIRGDGGFGSTQL